MDKFSLYDILGILLPGFVFLFMLSVLNQAFSITPYFGELTSNTDVKELSVLFSFALIFGAVFFTINFYFIDKIKWYNKVLGVNNHVADLYLDLEFLHSLMNEKLNKKAIQLYSKPIFFSKIEYNSLTDEDKKNSRDLQNEYYDIMYYELEYFDKISYAKTFQSFYFLFRHLVTVFLSILIIAIGLYSFRNLCINENWEEHCHFILKFTTVCIALSLVCILLAKWYRERMVMKMYWAYYTLLNNQKKNNE
nr:CRISPR-associated protein Csx27 [uncultured Chryseobacterium sp.]